jgi:redox-sensitive bicupin YhaK (pirin superfamily)
MWQTVTRQAPVRAFSEMLSADVELEAGAKIAIEAGHEERAIYVTEGVTGIAGDVFKAGRLLVFRPRRRNHRYGTAILPPPVPRRRTHGRPAPHPG